MKKQNLTEEIYRMRKLMNFNSEEFNENVTSEDTVIEESYVKEFIKGEVLDLDIITEQEPEKGGFGFGFNKKGKQNIIQKMRGVKRGGAMGGFDVSWNKESNKKLDTSQDVLAKMNDEVGDDEGWQKLPTEVKEALAQGYYTTIEEGLNKLKDVLSKKEIKYYGLNKLKKFFKKSQRWGFRVVNDSGKAPSELRWSYETGSKPDMSDEELSNEFAESIKVLNLANAQSNTIASNQCNAIQAGEERYSIKETVITKTPLSTIMIYPIKDSKTQKVGEDTNKAYIVGTNIKIPPNTEVFAAGRDKISGALSDVVNGIYKKILDSSFDIKVGKKVYTNTGREIVNAGNTLRLDLLRTISSASNTWTNEDVLDITHNNDGTKVKNFDSLETSGNNKKNQNLSRKRNNNLMNAVISLLGEKQGIIIDDKLTKQNEIRVTDTGGKVDEKKDNTKYKNPGQYAAFDLTIKGNVEYNEIKKASYRTSGIVGQFGISLMYEGKPPKGLEIDMGIIFGGKEKAAIVKARPILTTLENIFSGAAFDKKKLKSNPMHLRGGGGLWQNRRQKQWQKKIGNR